MLDFILDEISERVYVVDPKTYDLLYVNWEALRNISLSTSRLGKCYEILQGRDSPCKMCTNHLLSWDRFYTWEYVDPQRNQHFLLKNRLIEWEGCPARLEIAFDVTQKEEQIQSSEGASGIENLITKCAETLYDGKSPCVSLREILKIVGEYLNCQQIYVFETADERQELAVEWCAPEVETRFDKMRTVSQSLLKIWGGLFHDKKYVMITQLDFQKGQYQEEYALLNPLGIHSMVAVPLWIENHFLGYLAGCNLQERSESKAVSAFHSVASFVAFSLWKQHALDQLEKLSYWDSLTGLPNRNLFIEDMEKQAELPVGVLCININGMKEVNDSDGHKVGDYVLIDASKTIQALIKQGKQSCYRVGGDEFIIICEGISHFDFMELEGQLRMLFSGHKDYTASIGSNWLDCEENLSEVVRQAEERMYEDKKRFYHGKKPSKRYRHQIDDVLGLATPGMLQKLIHEGSFHIYYQPKFSVADSKLTGAEALVRLMPEGQDGCPPDKFIPVLESCRLIPILDFYVFEQVCAQLRKWLDAGKEVVPISTNFSRLTINTPDFVHQLVTIRDKYQIPPELLEVEITETVEADDPDCFSETLRQLQENNFFIAIDDFGVRNANISLLIDVNFHVLKVDKHVVNKLHDNDKAQQLMAALAKICHPRQIKMIAEGVETEEQLDLIRETGCDDLQGYLFSKPIDVKEFERKYL